MCAELDEKDRDLLHAIFAWAGQSVGGEPVEVGGFDAPSSPTGGGLATTFGRGPQYIEIMSWSFGASQMPSNTGQADSAGKVDFSGLKIKP